MAISRSKASALNEEFFGNDVREQSVLNYLVGVNRLGKRHERRVKEWFRPSRR